MKVNRIRKEMCCAGLSWPVSDKSKQPQISSKTNVELTAVGSANEEALSKLVMVFEKHHLSFRTKSKSQTKRFFKCRCALTLSMNPPALTLQLLDV